MEQFSIERAKQGSIIQTRCGFKVTKISYDTGIEEFPIAAVVMEIVVENERRRRKRRLRNKHVKTHIEPNMVLYHADGRLYEDKDDDFDLVIMEEQQ